MAFLKLLESIRTPFLNKVMLGLTYLGDEIALFLFVAIIFWCIDKRKGYRICTVCFSALDLTFLLKGFFMIARPWVRDESLTVADGAAGTAQDFSFPSGHSTTASSAYGSMSQGIKKTGIRIALLLLPLLVAFTRMYLGVHTPQDVVVGLAIGYLFSFLFYRLLEKLESRSESMFALNLGLTAFSVFVVLFLTLRQPGLDLSEIQAACYAAALKDAYTLMGVFAGLTVGRLLETRFIRFQTKADLPVQILKVVLGLAFTMLLRTGLKALLNVVLPGVMLAHAIRYFILVLFLLCIWPLTFPTFCKLTCKK